MRINTNISALNAYRNLGETNNAVSSSMQKLSSGFRINRAADDAAGLVEKLEHTAVHPIEGLPAVETFRLGAEQKAEGSRAIVEAVERDIAAEAELLDRRCADPLMADEVVEDGALLSQEIEHPVPPGRIIEANRNYGQAPRRMLAE